MSNIVIAIITAGAVAVLVWVWMKLAYLGRTPSQHHEPMSPTEKAQQMVLEVVLVVLCILLFLWWKQP